MIAPGISPAPSRIRTPPGTGTMRPPEAAIRACRKTGLAAARRANSRPPNPIPSTPHALPPAISGRRRLEPSSRFSAFNWPPPSSTTTVSGCSFNSRPFSSALSTIVEAWSRVSAVMCISSGVVSDDGFRCAQPILRLTVECRVG